MKMWTINLVHQLLGNNVDNCYCDFRFKGISNNQSVRGRPDSSNNQSANKKELRQRKASPGDQDKNVNDDEIVESCKVTNMYKSKSLILFLWIQMTYDATGCFHWCPSRNFDECVMTRQVRKWFMNTFLLFQIVNCVIVIVGGHSDNVVRTCDSSNICWWGQSSIGPQVNSVQNMI